MRHYFEHAFIYFFEMKCRHVQEHEHPNNSVRLEKNDDSGSIALAHQSKTSLQTLLQRAAFYYTKQNYLKKEAP